MDRQPRTWIVTQTCTPRRLSINDLSRSNSDDCNRAERANDHCSNTGAGVDFRCQGDNCIDARSTARFCSLVIFQVQTQAALSTGNLRGSQLSFAKFFNSGEFIVYIRVRTLSAGRACTH